MKGDKEFTVVGNGRIYLQRKEKSIKSVAMLLVITLIMRIVNQKCIFEDRPMTMLSRVWTWCLECEASLSLLWLK